MGEFGCCADEKELDKVLNKYIDLNTNLRKNATCKFDEDQAKLMNNSYFGQYIK